MGDDVYIVVHRFDHVRDFVPSHVFDCGQCFRWAQCADGAYIGVALSSLVRVSFHVEKNQLEVGVIASNDRDRALCRDEWIRYFDLDFDYSRLKLEFSARDAILREAIAYGHGIRILNQDLYEVIISFIISQNNNITRIKKNIREMSEKFGEYIGTFDGEKFYDFPKIEALAAADADSLAEIKLGYRTGYILDTARIFASSGSGDLICDMLSKISGADTQEAYELLISLPGIGPKVANCILLFSLGRKEVFPIDVWVKKTMCSLYGFAENDLAGMKKYAARHFGAYGGVAQQYLFFYMREKSGN